MNQLIMLYKMTGQRNRDFTIAPGKREYEFAVTGII